MAAEATCTTREPRRRRWLYVVGFLLLIVPYNDNGCGYSLFFLPLVAVTIGLAIVVASIGARSAAPGRRRQLAKGTLLLLLAFLLWMDAGPVLMALGLETGRWWVGYAAFAAVSSPLLFFASGWCEGERLPTLGRIGILLAATALIPSVPWNFNKNDALRVRAAFGEPLEVLQHELRGEYVLLDLQHEGAGDEQLRGVVGEDLDLVELAPATVGFFALGWCSLTIRDGRVAGAWFLYD